MSPIPTLLISHLRGRVHLLYFRAATPPPADSRPPPIHALHPRRSQTHSPAPKRPHNPMHNRDILPLNIINHHLAHPRLPPPIPQKQQIPPLERRFHTAGQNDDDGRGRVGRNGEAFPQHEGGAEDEGEVEELGQGLAGVEVGGEEGGDHGWSEGGVRWPCRGRRGGDGSGIVGLVGRMSAAWGLEDATSRKRVSNQTPRLWCLRRAGLRETVDISFHHGVCLFSLLVRD